MELSPDDADVVCARGARKRAFLWLGAAALAALLAVTLLSRGERSTQSVLAAAAERTSQTTARTRITLTARQDGRTVGEGTGSGVVDFAGDRFSYAIAVAGASFEFRSDGATVYVHSDDQWYGIDAGTALAEGASSGLNDPGALLDNAVDSELVKEAESLGEVELDGEPADRYRIVFDADAVREHVGARPGPTPFEDSVLDVYIGADGLVRRQVITAEGGGRSLALAFDFYAFGTPVEVKAPPAESVKMVERMDEMLPPA